VSERVVQAGDRPKTIAAANTHPDHLNTPRAIYNDQQQLAWRWDQREPFGSSPPNENPSGLGTFECNMRFPGQYFDKETNLAYNSFRDFDPGLGRYVQSDPIGLKGGINTYAYVDADPLRSIDPMGLQSNRYYEKCVEELRIYCLVVPLAACAIPCVASGNVFVGGVLMAICAPALNQLCMRAREKECARKWPS
jgi:RHS repeat-associated protein